MELISHSVLETRAAGARLAREARPGDVYALVGDLGCGKTEFVRGFVACLCDQCVVHSPTFTLVNIYETPAFRVYHGDFYRLKKPEELVEIGVREYFGGDGVCLVEWADMFPGVLPGHTRTVRFADAGNGIRTITFDQP